MLSFFCFTTREDSATLRSDMSALAGLQGRRCGSHRFILSGKHFCRLPGNQSDKPRGVGQSLAVRFRFLILGFSAGIRR